MSDNFYRAFEDLHRGPRELIKQRLQSYLPFVTPLLSAYPAGAAVDLGCGRGEWLEVLTDAGFTPVGVDNDAGMLQACNGMALSVIEGDAIAYLAQLKDESQVVVSAFHVIEHIPFDQLRELTRQAFRVLKPGGLLIMETPNPENIAVATRHFYQDPTHINPIPPALLEFTANHAGFARSKVLRLQEAKDLADREHIGISEVLNGASPDYAVIAQKSASESLMQLNAGAFAKTYGLSIDMLTSRFDAQTATLRTQLASALDTAQAAEKNARQNLAQLEAVYNSNSWRATRPLRWLTLQLRALRSQNLLKQGSPLHRMVRTLLLLLRKLATRWPLARKAALLLLTPFPALTARLRRIGHPQGEPATGFNPDNPVMSPAVLPATALIPDALRLPGSSKQTDNWVRLVGHVEGHYSMAIVNRGLATALEPLTRGQFSFIPYHGKPYDEIPVLAADQDAILHQPLRRSIPAQGVQNSISIVHHYPFIADELPSGLRGMFFAWEESVVPTDTVAHIQASFDLVWASSSFVKRTLLNSGCSLPVFVVPEGVDHLIGPDRPPIEQLQIPEGGNFRFLHVSSAFERKGVDVLLSAYLDAFSADDNVELYIKTFPNPHNQVHDLLARLSARHAHPARVIIDEQPLDDTGMLALYCNAHSMVLPTRGEGFNLPAAEALALGLPLITTGFGGHADFCTLENSLLINFQFASSRSHLRSSNSYWAEPDPGHLAELMRQLYNEVANHCDRLQQRRQAGIRLVRSTYSWQAAGQAILQSAAWLKQQTPPAKLPLRIALVSSWDTRCGIAEYAKNLLQPGLLNGDISLSVYCEQRTAGSSENVIISWEIGNTDSMLSTLDKVAGSDAEVVLVQHHPGFFQLSGPVAEKFLQLKAAGCVVVLELHSVLPLLQEHRLQSDAVSALEQIDRIIVHKVEDLNYLLALGLCNNLMLLPLGVTAPLPTSNSPVTRQTMSIAADDLVLGFFGFALEHKGIDTLIRAIKPLQQACGRKVHLVSVSSELDERSTSYIQNCRQLATRLGVSDCVHWHTSYLPIEQCQELLGCADYVLFPYRQTRESASAAVTIGLSTLKPVLVSEQNIFSDLAEVTFKMQGHQPGDIVQAVLHLLRHDSLVADLQERQKQWLDSRDWSVLCTGLLQTFSGLQTNRKISSAIAQTRPS